MTDPSDARTADLVAALRAEPRRTAVLLDFDGTLAPIVDDPADATPLPGVPEVLSELAAAYAAVGVVSGRPVSYLQQHLPAGVTLVGLYGLEEASHGEIVVHSGAEHWRSVIDDIAAAAIAELPAEVGIEHKGLSLTLHVRQHPDLAAAVAHWSTTVGERTGLHVRRARMSAELHPPVAADKGTIVAGLVAGLAAACFIGDDVGDIPAFDALDAFAADGGVAARFVVESTETAPELARRADVLLAGPPAVLTVLQALVP